MALKFEQFPYKKLLFAGAVLQLILGFVLYMTQGMISFIIPVALCVIALFCLLIGLKWHHKASRVIVRVLTWSVSALIILCSALLASFLDISNIVAIFGFYIDPFAARLFIFFVYAQTPLLFFIPAISTLAHAQQMRIDIFMTRIYSLIQLLFSIGFVIIIETNDYQQIGIKNIYYNLFFIAICLLTALCALAAFPIKTAWLNRLLNQPVSTKK